MKATDFYFPIEILRHKNRNVCRLYGELGLLASGKEETFVIPGSREMSEILDCDKDIYLKALHDLKDTGYLELFIHERRGFSCRLTLIQPKIVSEATVTEGVNVSTKVNSITLHNLYQHTKKNEDIVFFDKEGKEQRIHHATIEKARSMGASEELIMKAIQRALTYDVTKSKSGYTTNNPNGVFAGMIKKELNGGTKTVHQPKKETPHQKNEIEIPVHIYPTVGFSAARIDDLCERLNAGEDVSGDFVSPLFFTQRFPDDVIVSVGEERKFFILCDSVVLQKLSTGNWHIHWDKRESIKSQRAGSLSGTKLTGILAKLHGGTLPKSYGQTFSESLV